MLSLFEHAAPGVADPPPAVPPWLSIETLAEGQGALAERAAELQRRLAAGLEHAPAALAALPPEQVELLEAVREAEPLVREGSEHARRAARGLGEGTLEGVPKSQGRSLGALADARERFLDVRGLIEAIYAEEQRIAEVVNTDGPEADGRRSEFVPILRTAQQKNVDRGERLGGKLRARAAKLEALAAASEAGALDPSAPPTDLQRLEEDRKHLEIASQILTLALGGMEGVRQGLGEDATDPETIDWEWVGSDTAKAIEHLETLRRLFFSIVEHLRDVTRRQVDLADRTQDALALSASPDVDASAEAAPLVDREQGLAQQALVIANALAEQASDAGVAGDGQAVGDGQAADASNRLREAADHVLLGQEEMQGAVAFLSAPADLEAARNAQDVAVERLSKALAILEPPEGGGKPGDAPDPQGDQPQQAGSQQPEAEGSSDQAGRQRQEQRQAGLGADPGQLLQEVRDREAQRRRERAHRPVPYETVEKDW